MPYTNHSRFEKLMKRTGVDVMKKLEQLYEGKAKKVFATEDPDVVIVDYKDDATAFNGEKKGTIVGKGVINNRMTNYVFQVLEKEGVPTHYVEELSDRETAVKKVEIVPLEVIVRNVAAGSFSKRLGIEEGRKLLAPTLEFSYKDDDLGDPLINDYFAIAIGAATREEIDKITEYTFKVNDVLKKFFDEAGIDLIDGVSGVGAYAGALNIRTMPLKSRYLRIEAAGGGDGYAYGNISGAVTKGRFSLFAAGSYRRSDGYIHNTDFENYNGYLRMNYDSEKAGFFDFQAGYQNRSFGSNGFYAAYNPDQFEHTSTVLSSLRWVKSVGRFTLNSSVSYRKNFDRYDWTRGTPMNHHNTDNAGAEFWADCTWKGGMTSLGGDYTYNHIYSTNLGEPLPTPHGKYTHAKDRHVGNLWLRHVKQWERFDVSGSAGVSFTPYGTSALWSLSGGYRPVRGLRLEVGAAQSMRLPTFTDLYYTSPAQLNNLDLKPEHAITYRFAADYARSGWNASLFTYYRQGRDIIDWVWREELGKWHSEQESKLDTYGLEVSGGYTTTGFLHRISVSYGYIHTSKVDRVITSSALDYMKHKAAATVEFRFLRNCSLTLTGAVYDRNGSYTYYLRNADGSLMLDPDGKMMTEVRDFKPYFLLDGRLSWEKKGWKLYFDVMNMTDTRYFDFGGLEMPGVWFSGGIVVTIG